jgi:hypothetical protein
MGKAEFICIVVEFTGIGHFVRSPHGGNESELMMMVIIIIYLSWNWVTC